MELPPSSKYVAQRDESVSDDERNSLTKRLAIEFEAGRIPQSQYLELLDQLYEAKTMGELVPVAKCVPAMSLDTPAILATSTGTPGQLAPITTNSMRLVVIAGSAIVSVLILLILLLVLL